MNKDITFDQMVDSAVAQVIRSFGKGEDLRGACWCIVSSTARWAQEQEKERKKGKKRERKDVG